MQSPWYQVHCYWMEKNHDGVWRCPNEDWNTFDRKDQSRFWERDLAVRFGAASRENWIRTYHDFSKTSRIHSLVSYLGKTGFGLIEQILVKALVFGWPCEPRNE